MHGLKLHTDGTIERYKLTEERYNFIALQKSIDCDCIDIVHAVNLPEPYCLVVDDEALLKSEPTVNLLASYLYGTESHGQPICGDAIIMKDKFTDDGIDTVGLDEEDFDKLNGLLFDEEVYQHLYNVYTTLQKLLNGDANSNGE